MLTRVFMKIECGTIYKAGVQLTHMMQIKKIIEKLGFSQKEAKVYLAALILGESHVSDIAEKVKMPRTSTQVILDKLHKNGLINFYVMRRYKYWVAVNPEQLLLTLKKLEEMVQEALPRLVSLKKENRGIKSDKDLSKSLGLFHLFADASSQPVLITNDAFEIQYVNSAWEEQFNYSLEEIHGKKLNFFQSEKTSDSVYEKMWSALKTGKMFYTNEIFNKKKDGTVFGLHATTFPVKHNNFLFYIQILDEIF